MRLHALVHLAIVEIDALMDEGLPYLIERRIVEVLRLESGSINHRKTGVIAPDDVLFCQLHTAALLACAVFLLNMPNERQALRLLIAVALLTAAVHRARYAFTARSCR